MKKKFVGLVSLVLGILLCISLAACSDDKHEAKSEWTSNETMHWHECATEGHDDKLDEAEHAWNDGEVTIESTETADGVRTFTCTVCGETKTTPIGKLTHKHTFATEWSKDATNHWHAATCTHTDEKSDLEAHTFGAWTTKPGTGNHVDKVEQRKCSDCEYVEERTITGSALHDYDAIKTDETNHWFECSCGAQTDIEAHTYGNWSEKKAAAVDQDKQYSRKCTKCQYEDVLTFDNTKTNGTYCVVITSKFVASDKKYVVAQVVRGTFEVGDNIVIDGIEGTFLIDGIKENGKPLGKASCGQNVDLELSEETGDWSQVPNATRLAYAPNSVKTYTTFTAQITIDQSGFNGKLNAGSKVQLDLYNTDYMMPCSLVLPEGVNVAEDGKSYVVTITLPNNLSRAMWAGMEFSYQIQIPGSSSYVVVARGIILSVAD